jgi:hypothetical protein
VRQLHLVGFTSDHEGLVLAGRRGAKTGGYVVTMDDEFLDQLDEARRTRAGLQRSPAAVAQPARSRIESALSPREMQTRMRAGRTVAQVAAEAGVPIDWVERFAVPVLAEQAAAVERARQTTMRTQRRGYSDRALGPSVLRNLADRGIRLADDEFDELWTAFQLAENEWVIRFRYRWRGRDLDAEWLLDEGAGSLTPGNRQATDLGYVDPVKHSPPVKGLPPMRVLRRSAPVVAAASPAPALVDHAEPGVANAPRARKARKAAGASKSRTSARTTKSARTAKSAGTAKATKAAKSRSAKPRPAAKAPAKKAKRPAKAVKSSSARKASKASRPLKKMAKRAKALAAVRPGRVNANGSAAARPTRRAGPVSRAGGNGSRRSRS